MKEVLYRSTRGGFSGVKASEAILQGLAEDGGLFVPETMPVLDVKLSDLAGKSYQEVAYEVMKLFLTDYSEEDLKYCISHAYDSKFDTDKNCTDCTCGWCILSGTVPRLHHCIQRYGTVHPSLSDDNCCTHESDQR